MTHGRPASHRVRPNGKPRSRPATSTPRSARSHDRRERFRHARRLGDDCPPPCTTSRRLRRSADTKKEPVPWKKRSTSHGRRVVEHRPVVPLAGLAIEKVRRWVTTTPQAAVRRSSIRVRADRYGAGGGPPYGYGFLAHVDEKWDQARRSLCDRGGRLHRPRHPGSEGVARAPGWGSLPRSRRRAPPRANPVLRSVELGRRLGEPSVTASAVEGRPASRRIQVTGSSGHRRFDDSGRHRERSHRPAPPYERDDLKRPVIHATCGGESPPALRLRPDLRIRPGGRYAACRLVVAWATTGRRATGISRHRRG